MNLVPAIQESFRLLPALLVRVGGLPLAATLSLRCDGLLSHLAACSALRERLAAEGAALEPQLFDAIAAAQGNRELQKGLLNLKRNVFNRRPIGAAQADWIANCVQGPLAQALLDWEACRAEGVDVAHAGHALLDAHRPVAVARLQGAASDDAFRRGLLAANPAFERSLPEPGGAAAAGTNRRARQMLRTLLLYLQRTTHKTSPLAGLTTVDLALLDNEPMLPQMPAFGGGPRVGTHSVVRLNVAYASRVARSLQQRAWELPALHLQLQGQCEIEDERLRFVKRVETPFEARGPVHSFVKEFGFMLRMTPMLRTIAAQAMRPGGSSVAALCEALAREHGTAQAKAREALRLLVEAGALLVAGARQASFDTDHLRHWCDRLEAAADADSATAAARLRTLERLATSYACAPLAGRRELLAQAEGIGRALLQAAGSTETPPPPFYEDVARSCEPRFVADAAWRAALAPLAPLQRVLARFEPLAASRLTLRNLFKRRHGVGGQCTRVADFSAFFHEMYYRRANPLRGEAGTDSFGGGRLNPLMLSEVDVLQQAQQALRGRINAFIAARPGVTEIELPASLFDELDPCLPDTLVGVPLLSNSVYFQRCAGSDHLIVNRLYAGLGTAWARFLHLFDDASSQPVSDLLRRHLESLTPEGAVLAEFQGGHETNLNLHPPVALMELVLPGETGVLEPARRIDLSELVLRHDPVADEVQLYCPRLDRRVVPVYLGSYFPLALPELQVFLLHFSAPVVLRSELGIEPTDPAAPVAFRPRVRVGSVVLTRASWTCAAAQVPQRGPADGEFDYLARLDAWRRGLGLPEEVFVTLLPPPGGERGVPAADANRTALGRKPMYLDFGSPLGVQLFESGVAAHGDDVCFVEMLPCSADAAVQVDGAPHVSEFVAEISQEIP
ncbi:lantibiotic dehydratase [Xanthomonas albilineans]|uniref:lantibiotic dehydratase n=1 Tax=Xanthomonas albilineans TaxID=29447 RepID=UPI0027D9430B|nr:lantibiotic dehydratase [Xanthomonas albilineans]